METETKKPGRPRIEPPDNFDEVIELWRTRKIKSWQAMEQLNLERTTFYKLIKERNIERI